jgi:hypothetical protein
MSSAIAESRPNAWIIFRPAMKKRILFANAFPEEGLEAENLKLSKKKG